MAKRRGRPKKIALDEIDIEILRLRDDEKLTWDQIGIKLKRHRMTCRDRYNKAKALEARVGQFTRTGNAIETKNPKAAGEFMAALASPDALDQSIKELANRFNIPYDAAVSLARELHTIYSPTMVEARKVKLERLEDLWAMRAEEALAHMTPEKFQNATLPQLGILGGIATEKVLLLRGRPTQAVKTEEQRMKLGELAQAFLTEVARRGKKNVKLQAQRETLTVVAGDSEEGEDAGEIVLEASSG